MSTPLEMMGQPAVVYILVGVAGDLTIDNAETAATYFRQMQRLYHPRSPKFSLSMSGYDDDPRELWEIPEAVTFLQWWTTLADLDLIEALDVLRDDSLFLLSMCGAFGDEMQRQTEDQYKTATTRMAWSLAICCFAKARPSTIVCTCC